MLEEKLDDGLAEGQLRAAVDDLATVCRAPADDQMALLDTIDGFRSPVALRHLTDEQLGEFDALFAPGGHGSDGRPAG